MKIGLKRHFAKYTNLGTKYLQSYFLAANCPRVLK